MATNTATEDALQRLKDVVKKLYEQHSTTSGAADGSRLVDEGLVQLVKSRQANNSLSLETESLRERTSERKAELDQLNLQLQNLLYEKLYYEKEISACRSFRSAFSDEQIGLMPDADFFASASPEFQQGCAGDAHKAMLQRLAHELSLRKDMVKRLEDLTARKDQLADGLTQQKARVEGLRQHLLGVADASKPLQDLLTPPLAPKHLITSAELLPMPLYIIFSQLTNFRDLGQTHDVSVSITGSEEDAEHFRQLQAPAGGQAAADYQLGQHKGQQQPAANGNTDGLKRCRTGPSEDGSTLPSCTVHPLTVNLHLSLNGRPATIGFRHVLPHNAVVAGSEDPALTLLLASLFPGDTGSLEALSDSLPPALGPSWRPFRWAQHLAGLDVVPALPLWATVGAEQQAATLHALATYRGQLRVQALVEALQGAAEAAVALKAILAVLATRRFPPIQTLGKGPLAVILHWQQLNLSPKLLPGSSAAPTRSKGGSKPPTPAPSPSRAAAMAAPSAIAAAQGASQDEEEEEEGVIQEDGELEKPPTPLPAPTTTPPQDPASAPPHEDPADADAMDLDPDALSSPPLSPPPTDTTAPPSPSRSDPTATATSALQQILSAPLPPSPPASKYRCVLRCTPVELEAHVSVYHEYPLRPPRLKVVAVKKVETEKRGSTTYVVRSTVITSAFVNDIDYIEQQFNVGILDQVPSGEQLQVLAYQMHALRRCVDDLANLLRMETPFMDPMRKLQTRQRLLGRARIGILTPPL